LRFFKIHRTGKSTIHGLDLKTMTDSTITYIMIFPKCIEELILTYGEDMAILEELQKLKHCNSDLIRWGDCRYLSSAFRPLDRTISAEDNVRRRVLLSKQHFYKSPAGFVYRKIDEIEWRRLKMWIDCKQLTEEWGNMGSLDLLNSTGTSIPFKKWCPFLEKFKYKFQMWRHWDEYKVSEYLDKLARQRDKDDEYEEMITDDYLIGP
jgi:hypothetical protein